MLCSPEAAPAITYEEYVWKKNGQDLSTSGDEDARVQKLANGNLFISPVQFSDEGVYECHVSNVYGASFTKGNLTVLGRYINLSPLCSTMLLCKAKRHYLNTCQVSRYRILALHGSIVVFNQFYQPIKSLLVVVK